MPRKNEFKLKMVSIRLVKDTPVYSKEQITSPSSAVNIMGDLLCQMDREVLCVINLKTDGIPINCNIVTIGGINKTLAHPREMFKSSILSNAANMILMHNHPSGSLNPSVEDTILTDRMIKLCNMMDIPLLDHIIVGGDNSRYFSFREQGIMSNPYLKYERDYQKLQFKQTMVAEKDKEVKNISVKRELEL